MSKVKLEEASTAHGTLTERTLALTVPFMRAVVSAALGFAACAFVDDTQGARDGAIEWMLPDTKTGKTRAVRLLSAFVIVTLGRIVVASARRMTRDDERATSRAIERTRVRTTSLARTRARR